MFLELFFLLCFRFRLFFLCLLFFFSFLCLARLLDLPDLPDLSDLGELRSEDCSGERDHAEILLSSHLLDDSFSLSSQAAGKKTTITAAVCASC